MRGFRLVVVRCSLGGLAPAAEEFLSAVRKDLLFTSTTYHLSKYKWGLEEYCTYSLDFTSKPEKTSQAIFQISTVLHTGTNLRRKDGNDYQDNAKSDF